MTDLSRVSGVDALTVFPAADTGKGGAVANPGSVLV
jgi:hypothetical protein